MADALLKSRQGLLPHRGRGSRIVVTLRVAVIPVACVAVLLGFPWPTSGQGQSPLVEDEWQPATRVFWHVEAGYPIRASGGGTVPRRSVAASGRISITPARDLRQRGPRVRERGREGRLGAASALRCGHRGMVRGVDGRASHGIQFTIGRLDDLSRTGGLMVRRIVPSVRRSARRRDAQRGRAAS